MGPLSLLFRLPLLPVTGLIRIAEIIRDQAENELYNPASVRRELEEAERAAQAGELSEEELEQVQEQAVARMVQDPAASPAGHRREDGG